MFKVNVSKMNKGRDKEIDKIVDDMFNRAHRIKRIKRRKKVKEWLGRHLN